MTSKRLMMAGIIAMATVGMPKIPQKYYISKTHQSEEEKQDKLAKAQAKRERKAKLKENQRNRSKK